MICNMIKLLRKYLQYNTTQCNNATPCTQYKATHNKIKYNTTHNTIYNAIKNTINNTIYDTIQ